MPVGSISTDLKNKPSTNPQKGSILCCLFHNLGSPKACLEF